MMKLAFGCEARVGKSTVVNYLTQRYGGTELSFAQPLYDIMHYAQKRCNIEQVKDRTFLQWVGTDWGRKKDNDMWIKLLVGEMNKLTKINPNKNIYVSDVRFVNEINTLKNNGFIVIKIERSFENREDIGDSKSHSSETNIQNYDGVINWDYVVNNNNSLDDMYHQIDKIIETIEKTNA